MLHQVHTRHHNVNGRNLAHLWGLATSNSNCEPYFPGQINDGHICVGIPNQAGTCYVSHSHNV